MKTNILIPDQRIQNVIFVLRDQRVLIDADLAALYGVPTKRLNEQVKRNAAKFPEDFMFKLTAEEKKEVVAKCDHLQRMQFSHSLPYAFTEHGAIQAANVLNSPKATEMSVYVVRAFIRLRQLFINNRALSAKLSELDSRIGTHDEQISDIIKAIRRLMSPDGPFHRRKIGFHRGNR